MLEQPAPIGRIDCAKAPEPTLKSDPIAGQRYTSRDFMELEWEHMWSRVWNIGGLESEIANPSQYITHAFGRESLLFTRDEEREIHGFYNVCQHRGNRLVQTESGSANSFFCPYHGWLWSASGELLRAQDPEDFPQGDPCGKLKLAPVRVETWAGFIWFNLDPDAKPLADFLDPVGEQIDTYQMQHMVRTHHVTLDLK